MNIHRGCGLHTHWQAARSKLCHCRSHHLQAHIPLYGLHHLETVSRKYGTKSSEWVWSQNLPWNMRLCRQQVVDVSKLHVLQAHTFLLYTAYAHTCTAISYSFVMLLCSMHKCTLLYSQHASSSPKRVTPVIAGSTPMCTWCTPLALQASHAGPRSSPRQRVWLTPTWACRRCRASPPG